ncbi:histone deacetylase [Sphingobium sp. SCG-1]|uniref:histone deacetylase family protein n=1 Tax=Sphingobium sp. SCG-1 TaxID=2072936 RepID=UPI000CD6BC30|nr:histone deacetylase [Sphingobium sp. SCG-1]AUW58331.1 histone deacetylase [Sphingobium sp. SCG-1]
MFPLVHHPDYSLRQDADTSGTTRFPWDKYTLVRDLLRADRDPPVEHEAPLMPVEWVNAVHDSHYVDEVMRAEVPAEKARRIGFSITERLARRALRTSGGTWMAARLALDRGYAANGAGGSHHALFDTGAGYCIFNDLAIAAHRLLAEKRVQHVLIVDLDVHQGDGTASLLAGRADVTTFSIHAEKNFPARKAQSTLDVALPDATGDDAYLDALEHHLPRLIDSSAPDLILYQAGVDVHGEDRLGRLALSDIGLVARDSFVGGLARKRGIALASALGGGYGTDQHAVARRHADAMRVLAMSYYQ